MRSLWACSRGHLGELWEENLKDVFGKSGRKCGKPLEGSKEGADKAPFDDLENTHTKTCMKTVYTRTSRASQVLSNATQLAKLWECLGE